MGSRALCKIPISARPLAENVFLHLFAGDGPGAPRCWPGASPVGCPLPAGERRGARFLTGGAPGRFLRIFAQSAERDITKTIRIAFTLVGGFNNTQSDNLTHDFVLRRQVTSSSVESLANQGSCGVIKICRFSDEGQNRSRRQSPFLIGAEAILELA